MRSNRALLVSGSALSILFLSASAFAQGAPPPGAPPVADPNAPPAGYPPAGYPPAQQGYPPAQPGYPPPQQGYTPQTYAAPPAPPPVPEKHGFLPIIYLGANTFQGNSGKGLGTGFRLGTILGGRVNPQFSINGELTIDVLNPTDTQPGVDETAVEVDLAFSPLFHAPIGPTAEFVVGPKLGFMGLSDSATSGGMDLGSLSGSGYVFGLNAGIFFNVSPTTELGGLLSFEGRSFSKMCSDQPGFAEDCTLPKPDAHKVLGINGAVMF